MRSLAIRRIALAAMTIAGVLAPSSASLAVSAAVSIDTFRFLPTAVTVNVGDSVTWTNRDAAQHTATAPGVFDTGPLSQGQSRAIVMGTAGTFAYHCSIHPTMTGTVQVTGTVAPPAPTPVPTAAATSAPIPQPTATAAPAPTVAPTPTPAPPTPAATAIPPAASPSPTPVAALVPQASPAATVPPEAPAAGSEVPGGLIAGAGAVALSGAAAALALWRSRRRAA